MSSPCHNRTLPAVAALLSLVFLAGCAGSAASRERTVGTLRVCADPNNLPYSNRAEEGFENRIAELLAADLDARVEYTWWPQRRGFVRNTLGAGLCDVVIGVPAGYDPVLTTRPYYRSTYVFLSRRSRGLRVRSLDDPALRRLRIGVHLIGDDGANTPPAHALASRGVVGNLVGFPIYGDYSEPNPPARLVEAVADASVELAIVWGPFAGFFGPRARVPLVISPVPPDSGEFPLQFSIAMGVRRGETALRDRLDAILDRRRQEIGKILTYYGVPLVAAESRRTSPDPKGSAG